MEREIDFSIARRRMVKEQIVSRGIRSKRIIEAFMIVPRHLFVDPAVGARAYDDCSFPIGYSQTISQPYIQALMIRHLGIGRSDRVLEIGTGSGYQTAILSILAKEVYSIERLSPLSKKAAEALARIETGKIRLKVGDGSKGWEFYAPFDRIIVSAAMTERPETLLSQLSEKGTLIAPLASDSEHLVLFTRTNGRLTEKRLSRCSFVPLLKGVKDS